MNIDYSDKPKELKYSTRLEITDRNGVEYTISVRYINTLDAVGSFIKKQLSKMDNDVDATIYINHKFI